MSEQRYWTAVDRGIWDHPLWEGQRLSQREAFQWLFSNASFKPRRVRVGNHMVPLNRGQLVGARAYLAKTWGWGEQEVRTYLSVLEREGMITKNQHSNQKITIISVCNFDKYQSVSHKANQPTNQDLTNTQPRPNQSQNTNTRSYSPSLSASARENDLPEVDGLNGSTSWFVETIARGHSQWSPDFEYVHRELSSLSKQVGPEQMAQAAREWRTKFDHGSGAQPTVANFAKFVINATASPAERAPRSSSQYDRPSITTMFDNRSEYTQ